MVSLFLSMTRKAFFKVKFLYPSMSLYKKDYTPSGISVLVICHWVLLVPAVAARHLPTSYSMELVNMTSINYIYKWEIMLVMYFIFCFNLSSQYLVCYKSSTTGMRIRLRVKILYNIKSLENKNTEMNLFSSPNKTFF